MDNTGGEYTWHNDAPFQNGDASKNVDSQRRLMWADLIFGLG